MLPTNPASLDGVIIPREAGRSRIDGRSRVADGVTFLDLHPDSRSLRDRIFARGGIVKDSDIEIIDRLFVRRMIVNGLKQYARFCLLPIGENLAAARTLLWYPSDMADAIVGVNATEGTYDKARGLTCSSASIHFRTGYIPSQQGHVNSQGSLAFFATRNQGATGVDVGARIGAGSSTQTMTIAANSGGSSSTAMYSGVNGRVQVVAAGSSIGLWLSTRTSPTDLRLYQNITQIGTTVTTTSDGTIPNIEMAIGGQNNNGTVDTQSGRSISYVAVSPLGTPLNAIELYTTIVRDTLRALRRVA